MQIYDNRQIWGKSTFQIFVIKKKVALYSGKYGNYFLLKTESPPGVDLQVGLGGPRSTQNESGPTQSDFREQARSESESLSASVLEI